MALQLIVFNPENKIEIITVFGDPPKALQCTLFPDFVAFVGLQEKELSRISHLHNVNKCDW